MTLQVKKSQSLFDPPLLNPENIALGGNDKVMSQEASLVSESAPI